MYPLSVTLVGCQDAVQRNVLSMLDYQQASLEGQYSDVDKAISSLRNVASPLRLFVMQLRGSNDLSKLKHLSGTFVGQPVVAIVDSQPDQSLLLRAMRAGAAQVVPMPIMPDDFRAALDCIAEHYGHASSLNQAIAVSGVTGGCGATTLAVNLAYELSSQHSQSVILSELSTQLGKLAAYLDVSPAQTTSHLLSVGDRLDSLGVKNALTRVAERFDILVGEYRQITPKNVDPTDVVRLVELCRSMASYAVFDVPCTYDDMYFETLAVADQVVLVGEQKIPSIRTLKLVCEALERVDALKKLHIVINRYDPRLPGFGAERLKNLLCTDELLTIGNDFASVMAAINHGRPLRQEAPRSPALGDIDKVVRTLLNRSEESQTTLTNSPVGSPALFGRLIRRFGLAQ
ncbi:MAG: CpaE family protein [Gemmataceae bacterium]